MSTCSLARKPGHGTRGPRVLETLLHQTPRKAWKQVVPCITLGAPESLLPPNTHQLEPLYLNRKQAQRGYGVVQPPPTRSGSGTHRRRVARTEISRALGWREVEPGALKWLLLARLRPGRALGSGKTQKMGNIRACHCAVAGVSGPASGGSLSPLPTVHSRSLVLILVAYSYPLLPGSHPLFLVSIPAHGFLSLIPGFRPPLEHPWTPPSPARFPGARVGSERRGWRRRDTLTCREG